MAILRFTIEFSYVSFVVLLVGTILLYEPLELTQGWLVALIAPAAVLALLAFALLPALGWLRMSPGEKSHVTIPHAVYRIVLALVMLVAPVGLARSNLEIPDDLSTAILVAVIGLFIVNTGMLLFADYFIGVE